MTKKQFERLSNKFEIIIISAIGGGILGLLLLSILFAPGIGAIGGVAGTLAGGFVGFRNNTLNL